MSTDHRAIIRSLSDDQRQALRKKSDRKGLIHLAGHAGMIAITGSWIGLGMPGWQLVLLPHGILLIFLFTLLHETTHDTPFSTPWLNRTAGIFSGFIVLLAPRWFGYFHLAHHRHTHDPDRDPELASPKPETWSQYLRHLSGIPTWNFNIRTLARLAMGRASDPFVPAKARPAVIAQARIYTFAYVVLTLVSISMESAILLWLWINPVLLGQPFLRAYLLAEHALCPHVANMLENTRTTFTLNIVRFITWNMPYHTEHHTYPVVPFHQLPHLHEIMVDNLRHTEKGYGKFNRKYVQRF